MNREVHVRFWERLRVKVPRATRQMLLPRYFLAMQTLRLLVQRDRVRDNGWSQSFVESQAL